MISGLHIRVSTFNAREFKALEINVATMSRPRYICGHGKR